MNWLNFFYGFVATGVIVCTALVIGLLVSFLAAKKGDLIAALVSCFLLCLIMAIATGLTLP